MTLVMTDPGRARGVDGHATHGIANTRFDRKMLMVRHAMTTGGAAPCGARRLAERAERAEDAGVDGVIGGGVQRRAEDHQGSDDEKNETGFHQRLLMKLYHERSDQAAQQDSFLTSFSNACAASLMPSASVRYG